MGKLSSYGTVTSYSDTDTIPITTGGQTQNVPVRSLIRQRMITVGPSGSFSDYTCTGTNDHTVLLAAFASASTSNDMILLKRNYTYALGGALRNYSNLPLIGEDRDTTILQMGNNLNTTVFNNSVQGLNGVYMANFTIDGNGANQTTGGGGFVLNKFNDLTLENIRFKRSYNFNVLLGSGTGTTLTGTLIFTNGDASVVGSGTAFTTELSKGMIIKTAGGQFVRVASIQSNTLLELDRQFTYTTETGVSASSYMGNQRLRFRNVVAEGSMHTDNMGFGLLVDGIIEDCYSVNSGGGYGFGPDHCWQTTFRDCTADGNDNDGIGMETCAYSKVIGGTFSNSVSGNGIRMLSGSYRNEVIGATCRGNVNGVHVQYNSTSFGKPDENTFLGLTCELNSQHGMRIGGSSKNMIGSMSRFFNNGSAGIALATDNSVTPDRNMIQGVHCYDSQDTKTQTRGIWIATGVKNKVEGNIALDSDHSSGGIVDTGTGTILANNTTT
jgi:hypothetical protein